MVKIGAGSGAVQKAAEDLLKQNKETKTPDKNFSKVLQGKGTSNASNVNAASQTNQAVQVNQATATKPVDQSQKIDSSNLKVAQNIKSTQNQASSPLKSLLGTWSKDSHAMNNLMGAALKGGPMSSKDMLVLQSATYKISFELDTMSKLAETASGAIKTTMQTQV